MGDLSGAARSWAERRLRPRGRVDALGLGLQVLSLMAFVGELIPWPPDSLDFRVLALRLVTLLVGVVGYRLRRFARNEPLDYVHWP